MDLEELDSNLQAAVAKAEETGTTTPILKQVLKLFIQSSRLKNGKEELPKSEFKEPEKYPVSQFLNFQHLWGPSIHVWNIGHAGHG